MLLSQEAVLIFFNKWLSFDQLIYFSELSVHHPYSLSNSHFPLNPAYATVPKQGDFSLVIKNQFLLWQIISLFKRKDQKPQNTIKRVDETSPEKS